MSHTHPPVDVPRVLVSLLSNSIGANVQTHLQGYHQGDGDLR